MDVTDMVEYNLEVLNKNDLEHSFFQLSKEDPTVGFSFNALAIAGHTYPKEAAQSDLHDDLTMRLHLGSHVALYMRHQLEQQKGYTSTVGVSTNKLLSKLVGNLNKPKGQTTLMPPYTGNEESNVTRFMDSHDVGKVPGIGFKLAQKLREFVLQRPAEIDTGLVYGGTKETVTVADTRKHPDVNADRLEKLLTGPGSPHGIGAKIWGLLHGVDDTEVSSARTVPRQISIEDSYVRLDTMPEVLKELTNLASSLISRMRIDLLGADNDFAEEHADLQKTSVVGKKWLAHPKTLRLTTRPRQPLQPDGTRIRSFKRISHSGPLPNFVFSLAESIDVLAEKLVKESLITMFRKLHPEKAGWNLSLVNLAVTNMAETAGETKTANGRDIGSMFRKQEDVLKDFRVTDTSPPLPIATPTTEERNTSQDSRAAQSAIIPAETDIGEAENVMFDDDDDASTTGWHDDDNDDMTECCSTCGLRLPEFAMIAHQRFHLQAVAE